MRDAKKLMVAGAINFGILTAVVWFLVNQFWTVGGIGILQQQPWPLSSITACSVMGAVAGLALGIALAANRRKHSKQIAALCEKWGFEFIPDISHDQFRPYHGLSLFRERRWRGRNLMRGMTNGSDIDVLDFEYGEPGSEGPETLYGQTVAVFPDCGEDLPRFELKPRDLVMKFLGRTAGLRGMTFEAGDSTREFDREAIEQFGQLYFLSPPLENVWDSWERKRVHEEIGSDPNNSGDHQILATEAALTQFFDVDKLRFFSERPEWSVECDGKNLAIWRNKKVISAANRERFLEDANHIRRALLQDSKDHESKEILTSSLKMPRPADSQQSGAWFLGAFLGFFLGGLVGFGAAAFLLESLKDPPVALAVSVFFGPPICGIVLGAMIGNRKHKQRRLEAKRSRAVLTRQARDETDRIETTQTTESTATLKIGSEEVLVDCGPLTGTSYASFRDTRLGRGDQWLELRASKRSKLFASLILAMGLGAGAMGFFAPNIWQQWPFGPGQGLVRLAVLLIQSACWLTAFVFSAAGLLFLFGANRTRFDHAKGEFCYFSPSTLKAKTRPLGDIQAVQFISGQMHSPGEDPPYRTYQLNLVIDDANEPRINVCDNTDVAWLFDTGRQIAAFLNRPFLDLVSGASHKSASSSQPISTVDQGRM